MPSDDQTRVKSITRVRARSGVGYATEDVVIHETSRRRILLRPWYIPHKTRAHTYASVKGAVEVLTRYLAQELGPRGITVNTIAPGAVATDFSGGVLRDNLKAQETIASSTALGRHAVADDIGPAIAALLGAGNHWVTGQRIEVSSGMHL